MVRTFVISQFNYCPIVWHFCGAGDTHKIEKLHERALRFIFNDYESEYKEFLNKHDETTLYLKRVRVIAQEVYKATNGLSPKYISELLTDRNRKMRRPLDIYVPFARQVKFGSRTYNFEAPSIWNTLPQEVRKAEHFNLFKKLIKSWTS